MGDPAAKTTARKALVFGDTSMMQDVVRAARRIAPAEATVLITGETGTGKEVMARFIHEHSARATKPFIPMNCGAIPEALLESELFGHVRGAFTGAVAGRKGRLAMADGGTLFLDEVGELPLALQVKLLRVLQERVYEPVGGNESVSANFRLIAATNRNLEAEVEAGRFRRDLYYRLMVCPLELPALRDRAGDVAQLFLHFWRERGETRPVEPGVLQVLTAYAWPGNVRELENLVERVSVLAEGPVVRVEDIPAPVRPGAPRPTAPVSYHFPPAEAVAPRWTPPVPSAPAPGPSSPSAPAAPAATTAPPPDVIRAPPTPPEPLPFPQVAAPEAVRAAPQDSSWTAAPVAPLEAPASSAPRPTPPSGFPVDLPSLLRKLEDEYIDAALQQAGGNKKAAADLLGLQRTTLVEKLRRRTREAPAPGPSLASGA
ncbi:MAG: sigma 54-interacting transcriptional regulator [Myxococcota bacterium]